MIKKISKLSLVLAVATLGVSEVKADAELGYEDDVQGSGVSIRVFGGISMPSDFELENSSSIVNNSGIDAATLHTGSESGDTFAVTTTKLKQEFDYGFLGGVGVDYEIAPKFRLGAEYVYLTNDVEKTVSTSNAVYTDANGTADSDAAKVLVTDNSVDKEVEEEGKFTGHLITLSGRFAVAETAGMKVSVGGNIGVIYKPELELVTSYDYTKGGTITAAVGAPTSTDATFAGGTKTAVTLTEEFENEDDYAFAFKGSIAAGYDMGGADVFVEAAYLQTAKFDLQNTSVNANKIKDYEFGSFLILAGASIEF